MQFSRFRKDGSVPAPPSLPLPTLRQMDKGKDGPSTPSCYPIQCILSRFSCFYTLQKGQMHLNQIDNKIDDNHGIIITGDDNTVIISPVKSQKNPHDNSACEPQMKVTESPVNIIWRWVASVITLLADCFGLCAALTELSSYNAEELAAFILSISGYIALFIIAVISLITVYLFCSTFSLTVHSRYGRCRRLGLRVLIIRPEKCPICNSKTKLEYDQGNYIVCTQNKKVHQWPVYFRNE